MARISSGSMVLLTYKLNNVCDADHRPANGAQRTMIIHIYHNILWLSIRKRWYIVPFVVEKANTHYLRIKCVLQAHHENNAYCVRIKGVLLSQRITKYAPVAQLDRVTDSDSVGRWFESSRAYHNVETKKMSPAKSPNISGFFATQTAIFLCTKTQM